MLSKQEVMQQMWIAVTTRFPDPDKHKDILIYNEKTGLIRHPLHICIAKDVQYTKDIMSGKTQRTKNTISACEFTHWMPIYPLKMLSRRRS